MEYSMDTAGNRILSPPASELTAAELNAVAGGASNNSYNVFYAVGYVFGEAAAWIASAAADINSAYARGIEQSNGAILAYML
jgi:hypothetical protein